MTVVKDWRLGLFNYSCNVAILGYIIGKVLLQDMGYLQWYPVDQIAIKVSHMLR
jgi:hypothetical protein